MAERERIAFHVASELAETETLWGAHLGDERYRIENVPFFTSEVSFGDVVATKVENGVRQFARLVARGGHTTFVFHYVTAEIDPRKFLEFLQQLNLRFEAGRGMVAVDVEPQQSADEFYEKSYQLGYPEDSFALDALCVQH